MIIPYALFCNIRNNMKNKLTKVLFVATSRQTMGGISSVLKRYEKMEFWKDYRCAWLETQVNKGIWLKLWYMIKAYITMLFIVPRYDIIHFHTVPGMSIKIQLPVFLYSCLWRKRTIIHIHVGDSMILDHKNDGLFKYVLAKATKVVVLADSFKGIMKQAFNVQAEVLYNPIDSIEKIEKGKKDNYILFASIARPNKGYDTLLKAYRIIAEKHPEWGLVMAGFGDSQEAKDLICELELTDKVAVHKWCDRATMNNLYKNAGIFCIASLKEGFPMTFLEAASYGVPIVTTPVGGLKDIIKNEENCMVFNFNDHTMLAEQIIKLIENNTLRDLISKELKLLIKNKFSVSVVNRDITSLYNNIIPPSDK